MSINQPKRTLELKGCEIQESVQQAGSMQFSRPGMNLVLHHLLSPATLKCSAIGCTQGRRTVPGDIHIIPAGADIDIYFEHSAHIFLFRFESRAAHSADRNSDGVDDDIRLTFQWCLRDSQISSLVHTLREEVNSGCIRGRDYINDLCSALTRYVVSTYSAHCQIQLRKEGGLPPNRLRFVLDHIHSNINARLMSKDLAKLVQMSPQHFGNLFRQSTGKAPYEYVIYERIERGKRLLQETKLPIMAIALELGFAHHSHFGDTFRHVTGMTPRQYRLRYESFPSSTGNQAA